MKKSLKRNVEEVDFKKPAAPKEAAEDPSGSEDVGPMLPPGFVPSVAASSSSTSSKTDESSDSDSDESSSEDEDDSRMTLPISSEITLNHGTKPISATVRKFGLSRFFRAQKISIRARSHENFLKNF